jgi:hypothetical protein
MTIKAHGEVPEGMVEVFTKTITRKGKVIVKKDGGLFHFYVPADKYKPR